MQRSKFFALAAGALMIGGAVAAPIMSGSASASTKRFHFVFTESTTEFHFIDAPASAPADGQAGDTITFESSLSRNGRAVGTLEGHCIQIRADGTLDDCDVTVTIGTGSYRMSGPFNPTTGSPLTIVGGAGAFVGAAGTDSIVNQPDGTAIHTVDFVRP